MVSFENLGTANTNAVYIGGLKIWFSYSTPVGYAHHGRRVCCVNEWSVTTGKLLNQIEPDHGKRVDRGTFCRMLDLAVKDAMREML